MARVRQRDRQAFELLVARHLSPIHGYVVHLTGSQADADEISQEVFLRVWQRAATFRPGRAQVTTWLHRIAHNQCIDRFRRPRPGTLDDPDAQLAALEDEAPGPEARVAAAELQERLQAALLRLPQNQRSALLLCQVQGLSNEQAAEVMHLGVRAVESLLARARRTLRDALRDHRPERPGRELGTGDGTGIARTARGLQVAAATAIAPCDGETPK